MNFKSQALSRNEMKEVQGGTLYLPMCPMCTDDPYWSSYQGKNSCVAWGCLHEATPPPKLCPIWDPNC